MWMSPVRNKSGEGLKKATSGLADAFSYLATKRTGLQETTEQKEAVGEEKPGRVEKAERVLPVTLEGPHQLEELGSPCCHPRMMGCPPLQGAGWTYFQDLPNTSFTGPKDCCPARVGLLKR